MGETAVDPIMRLKADAEQAVKVAAERSVTVGGLPLVMLFGKHTHKLRLYLDCNGRLFRSLWRSKINGLSIPAMGQDGPVETLTAQLKQAGDGDAWRFNPREYILALAYIVESTQKDSYMKLNQLVVIGFSYKLYNALMARINEWDAAIVGDMLNPLKEMHVWSVEIDPGNKSASAEADSFIKTSVPALSPDTLPLTEMWQKEGEVASDQDLTKCLSFLKNRLANLTNVKSPDTNVGMTGTPGIPNPPSGGASTSAPGNFNPVSAPVEEKQVESTPEVKKEESPEVHTITPDVVSKPILPESVPETPPTPQETSAPEAPLVKESPAPIPDSGNQVCPNEDKGLKFGQHQVSPDCILCDIEDACKAATGK